jgi:hypothetical protein
VENKERRTVVLADGKRLDSVEGGSISIRCTGYRRPVLLTYVLIVPGLNRNLLSVTKLLKLKIEVRLIESQVVFSANEVPCAHGEMRNNLFVMSGEVMTQRATALSVAVKYDTLHRQLNHMCEEKMKRYIKNKNLAVQGDRSIQCDVCAKAKHVRTPFSKETKITKILSIVSSDLAGPMRT